MKRIILFITFFTLVLQLNAQRSTDEVPYGLREGLRVQPVEAVALPAPDITRITQEDVERDQKPGPLRYAYPVRVNFTPENSGDWQLSEVCNSAHLWRKRCL